MKLHNYNAPGLLSLGASLLFLLMGGGCSRGGRTAQPAPLNEPIRVSTAVRKDVPIQIRTTGFVTPFASIAIKSRVDGEVQQALFNEGDPVKRGETMFAMDSRLLEANLRQAQANLQRDEALSASAVTEAQRNQALFQEGIGAAELAEQTRAAADAFQATVAADRVAVEKAQLQRSFCRITSPIDGRVAKLLAGAGNLVRNNETLLAIVNQVRPVYVDFLVPKEQLPTIQEKMASGQLNVSAAILDNSSDSATGKLVFMDHTGDSATAMVSLRARFANDEEALWPGETVNVTLTLATLSNAIVVPASAVQTDQTGRYLLVVKPDLVVERRPVAAYNCTFGETIIESGVQAGERVVSSGQARLTPGKRIKIQSQAGDALAGMP